MLYIYIFLVAPSIVTNYLTNVNKWQVSIIFLHKRNKIKFILNFSVKKIFMILFY